MATEINSASNLTAEPSTTDKVMFIKSDGTAFLLGSWSNVKGWLRKPVKFFEAVIKIDGSGNPTIDSIIDSAGLTIDEVSVNGSTQTALSFLEIISPTGVTYQSNTRLGILDVTGASLPAICSICCDSQQTVLLNYCTPTGGNVTNKYFKIYIEPVT